MTHALPIKRATVEELEKLRAVAIQKYGEAFDALADAMIAGGRACVSQSKDGIGVSEEARDALLRGYQDRQTWETRNGDKRTYREVFVDSMTATTDRAMWAHIVESTDLERLMDRQARDEFRASMNESPPACTVQNVFATLMMKVGESQMMFQRGIANAFAGLDRRFKSHDGFKLGARVILDRAFDTSWSISWNYHGRKDETLRDIERVLRVLDGQEHPEKAAGIVGAIDAERTNKSFPILVQGEFMRVRIFKNGNAHLWFERPDLMKRVNLLLADYYGESIGEGSEVADVSDLGPGYHLTPAKNFGLFETNEETARKLFDRIETDLKGKRVLEPSAGRGMLADMARAQGATVQCVEVQAELATTLREKGHAVRVADFLTLEPAALGLFDVVVMNPPFDRGRDCDHVRHALKFLKPGGVLVAIMAAGTEFREDKRTAAFRAMLLKQDPADRWGGHGHTFRDLPAGSFAHAGTNVNTCTVAVRKPAA